MTFEEKVQQYAKLIVQCGVCVEPGQDVVLSCPIEEYEFARMVEKEAYLAGAKDVIMNWRDDVSARMRYDYAPMEAFENVPEWLQVFRNSYAREGAAFIVIDGKDPEIFKGVDREKQLAATKAGDKAFAEYLKLQSAMRFKWNISAVPSKAWAAKVFPELSPEEGVAKLWEAVFHTVRIGDGDPVKKWMDHAEALAEKCKQLNQWQLQSLTYKNSLGTDFTVGLVENNHWEGGADTYWKTGVKFFANMPTEEVFTMPDNRKAEGTLVSALPVSYKGSLIDKFRLTFHEGKVVEYHAEVGEDSLKMLLDTDEGSRRLGEVALVPYPAPVSELGILFYHTLFDENAACHFALGACYETNLQGGEDMTEEELHAHGGNTSMNHVDFMVGTPDLSITGITKDGQQVQIFKDGTWAF